MNQRVVTPITQALAEGKLTRAELRDLMTRSDWFALRQLALWLVLLFASAAPAQPEDEGDYAKISMGRGLFRSYCTSCHGAKAEGDGSLASSLRVTPANLTTIAQRNSGSFPLEQVMQKIDGRKPVAGHGSADMPVWGTAFGKAASGGEEQVLKRVEALAHYIRSLQIAD